MSSLRITRFLVFSVVKKFLGRHRHKRSFGSNPVESIKRSVLTFFFGIILFSAPVCTKDSSSLFRLKRYPTPSARSPVHRFHSPSPPKILTNTVTMNTKTTARIKISPIMFHSPAQCELYGVIFRHTPCEHLNESHTHCTLPFVR